MNNSAPWGGAQLLVFHSRQLENTQALIRAVKANQSMVTSDIEHWSTDQPEPLPRLGFSERRQVVTGRKLPWAVLRFSTASRVIC